MTLAPKLKVSIICATVGPLSDVEALIQSVAKAVDRANFAVFIEFILVDQSGAPSGPAMPASENLQLVHVRHPTRGLSLNRNIGLARASGDWFMFIDSDCLVAEEFFHRFAALNRAHPSTDHFIGRILATDGGAPLFRKWPDAARQIPAPMLWYYATSVNSIFCSNTGQRFDERFGLGARYGSCEDVDFFLRLKTAPFYTPDLVVFHPDIFKTELPREKLASYSFGFGALCAKHLLPLGVAMLFASLLKKAAAALVGRATPIDVARAAKWRLKGFCAYLADRSRRSHA